MSVERREDSDVEWGRGVIEPGALAAIFRLDSDWPGAILDFLLLGGVAHDARAIDFDAVDGCFVARFALEDGSVVAADSLPRAVLPEMIRELERLSGGGVGEAPEWRGVFTGRTARRRVTFLVTKHRATDELGEACSVRIETATRGDSDEGGAGDTRAES